jgi:ABC-type multidrug transport system fused ATPase/permease subunit
MGNAKPPSSKGPGISVLLSFCTRQEIGMLVSGSVCAFIQGASRPALSYLFGAVLGTMGDDPADLMSSILTVVYALIGLTVIVLITASLWFYLFNRVALSLTHRVQRTYLAAVLCKDIGWFDMHTPAEIPSRLSADIEKVQSAVSSNAGNFVSGISQAVCGFALGFVKGWQIALVVMGAVPVIIFSRVLMARSMKRASKSAQLLYAKAGAVAEEVLMSIRTVAAFGQESRESQRYSTFLEEGKRKGVKVAIQVGFGISLVLSSMFAAYAVAIYVGGILIENGVYNHSTGAAYTGADIYVILTSVIMGAFALGQLGPSLQAFTEGTTALEGLLETIGDKQIIEHSLLRQVTLGDRFESTPISVPSSTITFIEEIRFTDVCFTYPSRLDVPAIQSLSLVIQAGQKVAFVGGSGSGKSTSIALLERFYDPSSGSISINGIDVKCMQPNFLRSLFGYVGQEPVMFATSIRENLLYGLDVRPGDDKLIHCLEMANVLQFVNSLPDGLDTYCGPGGSQMSGGQKQRIAIARALLRDPQVLLLDEATSALDNESEKMVQRTIDSLNVSGELTTISVAHRLSTIRNSDVIFVLQKGGVLVEQGTHSELMARDGVYRSLVASQERPTDGTRSHSMDGVVVEEEHVKDNMVLTPTSRSTLTILPVKSDEQKEKERIAAISKAYSVPWKRLLMFTKGTRWLYLPGAIGAGVKGAVFPVHALLFSSILTWYYIADPTEMMRKITEGAWMYAGLSIAVLCFTFIDYWSFAHIGESFTCELRSVCFKHILSQEIGFFDKSDHAPAKLLISLSSWAAKMNVLVGTFFAVFVEFIASMVAGLTIAFIASAKLTGILIATLPLLVGSMVVVSRVMWHENQNDDMSSKQASLVASEAIQNMRTVRALTAETTTLELYKRYSGKRVEEQLNTGWRSSLVFGVSAAMVMVPYAIGFYVGGLMVSNGEIDMQQMTQVLLGLILTSLGAGSALAFLPDINAAKAACHDIFELLDKPSAIDPFDESRGDIEPMQGKVSFDNVFFAYPERPDMMILKGLSFTVKAGQKIALVGPSGSGKSTVMGLLLRFYDPTSGSVFIDSTNIKEVDVSSLRKLTGYVGQEPVLFDMSMDANVKYGAVDDTVVTREDLERVRGQAKLDFVDPSNVHWDTVLGPKGGLLSGGQKQRTAIARAMIRDPSILLLDEATSALDSASEQVVQLALDTAATGRTTFVIAHRLSTVQDADVILVIADGRLVESGTHEELIAKRQLYYQLYKQGNQ